MWSTKLRGANKRSKQTERLYAQHDANHNVTSLTNTSGTVQQRFVYDPYGSVTVLAGNWIGTSDAYDWSYRFQGGQLDKVSNTYVFQWRDYDPGLGRWLQEDPTGSIGSATNFYQLVGGHPATTCDPTGLDEWNGLHNDNMPTGIWYQDAPVAGEPHLTRRYYYRARLNWFWWNAEFIRAEVIKTGTADEVLADLGTKADAIQNCALQVEVTAGNVVELIEAYVDAAMIVDGSALAKHLVSGGYKIITKGGRKLLAREGRELTEQETKQLLTKVSD